MKPRQLVLKPSYRLACLLALVSFLACVLVLIMPFSGLLKLTALVLLMLVATYSIARDALLILPWSCYFLTLNKDQEVVVAQKNGKILIVRVLPTSLVMPQLTVINFRAKSHYWSRNLIILSDSIDADEWRLWRVWLKWGIKN